MILDFIRKVWSWVANFFDSIFNIFGWLLDAVIYIASNVPLLLFKVALDLVLGALSLLSLGSLPTMITQWVLPPALAYLVGQMGIDIGLGMLATAYSIRFALNLIPSVFTRV